MVRPVPWHGSAWNSCLPPTTGPVLFNAIGRTTSAASLKESLDASAERTRAIASRVAQASVKGGGFALPVDPATGQPVEGDDQVNVEAEMTALADEQLRFEATAKLLEKTYAQLRTSMKDR
jgi:hypothetical protein